MKKVIAKKDFIFNGKSYIVGDEIETKDINVIITLNEKGFIEDVLCRYSYQVFSQVVKQCN